MQDINLITIFLTGLLTGGLTCMAVQGGLLAATLTQREEERLQEKTKKTGNALPITAFLVSKLIAYSLLGALLGLFGSVFQLSLGLQSVVLIMASVFMIGMALNILEVHSLFRYFVIQPPKFLTRFVRKQSKSQDVFAPALLGAATVFIPCGTTQAMMALAIASGNPFSGALVLFAFVLGTSPVFFLLGYFTTKLSETLHKTFLRFAAYTIIFLALFNMNNALALSGRPLSFDVIQSFWCSATFCTPPPSSGNIVTQDALEQVTITMDDYDGYSPKQITAKAGSTLTLQIKNEKARGCVQSFTIPSFGIQKIIPQGKTETVTIAIPNTKTDIPFMCSMGMYRGVITVI